MPSPQTVTQDSEGVTLDDLVASAGRGPRLEPGDIAATYYSGEEFLAALDAQIDASA